MQPLSEQQHRQIHDLLLQQKSHFLSLLQASNKDFAGGATILDSPRRQDSLLYEEQAALAERHSATASYGSRRIMIHKNK